MVFEEWTTNGGGRIAVARLNSPRNLNSLSMDMIRLLKPSRDLLKILNKIELLLQLHCRKQ